MRETKASGGACQQAPSIADKSQPSQGGKSQQQLNKY